MSTRFRTAEQWAVWAAPVLLPAIVTALLVGTSHQTQRDDVFIYLGRVAIVGFFRGLWPALVCAAISFLLVDYFFVPPGGTFTIADEQDIVNLFAFLIIAVVRETALRMTAEHMDRRLGEYLPSPTSPLEFRGRIVLCLPIRSGLEDRIRAVFRYAAAQGTKLSVVAVRTRKLTGEEKGWLGAYAALTHQLRGEFVRLEGSNVAAALARYIGESQATEVVLGHRRQTRWHPLDTTSELIRRLAGVDVHILRVNEPASLRAG